MKYFVLLAVATAAFAQENPDIVPTCEKQPYKKECQIGATVFASQFTLRWYVRDGMCCSYPWGFCPGDELNQQNAIRTKEHCEAFCLNGAPAHVGGGGSSSGGSGGNGGSPSGGDPTTGGNGGSGASGSQGGGHGGNGGSPNTGGQTDGGAGTGSTGPVPAEPTCEKLPYKKECQIGSTVFASQFTLRYYVRDGMCCSYPFGWCPGDEINQQGAIRTKEHCEAFCLNGAPAQPPTPVAGQAPSAGGSGSTGGSPSSSGGHGAAQAGGQGDAGVSGASGGEQTYTGESTDGADATAHLGGGVTGASDKKPATGGSPGQAPYRNLA